ncbi:MAG: hypothetical protein ACJ8DE_00835 [Microvirga sp.]
MLDPQEMQRLADAQASVSDKIRALDRAGLNRAEIARFLSKRYQHVRNVLEADKLKGQGNANPSRYPQVGTQPAEIGGNDSGGSGESRAPTAFFRLTAERDGSLVLPRHILEAFGAAPGEVLIGVAQPGEIVLRTAAASLSRAQELIRALIPGDDSLADSLVADRRREAEQERADG